MNAIKLKNRYKLAVKRAMEGDITGQDIKAIVEYQLRDSIKVKGASFDDVELALMASYMMAFN